MTDEARHFCDIVGILTCIVWLVWKYMPNGFMAPEDDKPKRLNPFKSAERNEGSKHLEDDHEN